MRPQRRAAQLRRRIAYLTAVHGADGVLTSQSDRLQEWRFELKAQGYLAYEVDEMFRVEENWFRKLGRPLHELLEELKRQLPEA